MFRESRYYLTYEMNGVLNETTELYSRSQASIEKRILEEDGAKNVKVVPYRSRLI
jgi:hypothetical protein